MLVPNWLVSLENWAAKVANKQSLMPGRNIMHKFYLTREKMQV